MLASTTSLQGPALSEQPSHQSSSAASTCKGTVTTAAAVNGGNNNSNVTVGGNLDTELVLAALKLINMAGLLDLEEFTLHQWMFHRTAQPAPQSLTPTAPVEKRFRPFSLTLKQRFEKRLIQLGVPPESISAGLVGGGKTMELYESCRMLNDTSIQTILARQSISTQARQDIVARDFLQTHAKRPIFETDKYIVEGR